MQILTIDIGGSSVKWALADENGSFSAEGTEHTSAFSADQLLLVVVDLFRRYPSDGIAISTAGQVDPSTGRIISATGAIPGYTGFLLKERLETALGVPTTVENDVHSAALGAHWKENLDETTFLALTLGTGIGGAIVINGEIFRGARGSAAEFGHMTLNENGRACACGLKGCYETYAATSALSHAVQHELGIDVLPVFFKRCRSGEEEPLAVLDAWIIHVAEGLKGLVHIFNPSLILIGGGITAQGEFLRSRIETHLLERLIPVYREGLSLRFMSSGNQANLYGALLVHLRERKLI